MELKDAQAIVEEMDNDGVPARVVDMYSGLGMFGRTTAAVVSSSIDYVKATAKELGLEVPTRSDNFGRDYIVY